MKDIIYALKSKNENRITFICFANTLEELEEKINNVYYNRALLCSLTKEEFLESYERVKIRVSVINEINNKYLK